MEDNHIFFHRPHNAYGFLSQWFTSPFTVPLSTIFSVLQLPFPSADSSIITQITTILPPSNPTPDDPLIKFICAEQFMMFSKALLFSDLPSTISILSTPLPQHHRRLGRAVADFDPHIWDAHKLAIVRAANMAKFSQNPGLRRRLLATRGRMLVEASPRDRVWGIGFGREAALGREAEWGENALGRVLGEVRAALDDVEGAKGGE